VGDEAVNTAIFKSQVSGRAQALLSPRKPLKGFSNLQKLYRSTLFSFRESVGQRLGDTIPESFKDVNTLQTDLQHDVDHGDLGEVKAKKKIRATFKKYAGAESPEVMDPSRFVLVQANLLSALELDLKNLALPS
jgi:hypothetical protein